MLTRSQLNISERHNGKEQNNGRAINYLLPTVVLCAKIYQKHILKKFYSDITICAQKTFQESMLFNHTLLKLRAGVPERLKNKIFQSRDLCLRALDTNSLCAKNVRRNEAKYGE